MVIEHVGGKMEWAQDETRGIGGGFRLRASVAVRACTLDSSDCPGVDCALLAAQSMEAEKIEEHTSCLLRWYLGWMLLVRGAFGFVELRFRTGPMFAASFLLGFGCSPAGLAWLRSRGRRLATVLR